MLSCHSSEATWRRNSSFFVENRAYPSAGGCSFGLPFDFRGFAKIPIHMSFDIYQLSSPSATGIWRRGLKRKVVLTKVGCEVDTKTQVDFVGL